MTVPSLPFFCIIVHQNWMQKETSRRNWSASLITHFTPRRHNLALLKKGVCVFSRRISLKMHSLTTFSHSSGWKTKLAPSNGKLKCSFTYWTEPGSIISRWHEILFRSKNMCRADTLSEGMPFARVLFIRVGAQLRLLSGGSSCDMTECRPVLHDEVHVSGNLSED